MSFEQIPGEISIVDSRRPFEIQFAEPVDRVIVVVPDFVLEPSVPVLRRRSTLKIDSTNRFAALARQHILNLAVFDHEPNELEANLLTSNLCNLIALATMPSAPHLRRPDKLLENLISFCKLNLFSPDISPKSVAGHFGISVRALHLCFQHVGETFGSWLLQRRLEACNSRLHDPHQSHMNISEIAFQSGFNDLSHFCRVFKAKYGLTAREARARVRLTGSNAASLRNSGGKARHRADSRIAG